MSSSSGVRYMVNYHVPRTVLVAQMARVLSLSVFTYFVSDSKRSSVAMVSSLPQSGATLDYDGVLNSRILARLRV